MKPASGRCNCFDPREEGHTNCPHCKSWAPTIGRCMDMYTVLKKNKPVDDDVGWARW